MEQNIDEKNSANEDSRRLSQHTAARKAQREFARELRALGQEIEKFRFSSFDLKLQNGIYVVTGKAIPANNVNFSFCRFVLELLRRSRPAGAVTATVGESELRFSAAEVEKFELSGRIRRRDPGKLPDPYSVSQILRGAGSYLDRRHVAELQGIALKDRWVTVTYRTAEGQLEQAKQDLEYFYDYWVKMYLRRSNRPPLPPPSDPTLFVTWEDMQKIHRLSDTPR